jgi:hypothetical protein
MRSWKGFFFVPGVVTNAFISTSFEKASSRLVTLRVDDSDQPADFGTLQRGHE